MTPSQFPARSTPPCRKGIAAQELRLHCSRVQFPPPPFDALQRSESNALSKRSASKGAALASHRSRIAAHRPPGVSEHNGKRTGIPYYHVAARTRPIRRLHPALLRQLALRRLHREPPRDR